VRVRGRAVALRARILATCATLALALWVGTARTQLERDGG
jgi:hypothetical protein